MTRSTVVAFALVCVALAAVGTEAVRRARHDRAALVDRFGEDRLHELLGAARQVEQDLGDIGADLRFARQFVTATGSREDQRRELTALLGMVRHYRAIAIFDGGGGRLLAVAEWRDGRYAPLVVLAP